MFTLVYVLCALAQATLAVIAIRLFRAHPSLSAFMLILPIAAVVWDNSIIALGRSIGDGPLLVGLSWPRFIGHALFTPAWIVTGIGFAWRAGAQMLGAAWVRAGQWVLYAVAVVFGFWRSVVDLRMELSTDGGLVYYRNAGTFAGPPIGSVLMLLVVLIGGVVVWRCTRWPWMVLGSLVMLGAALVPTAGAGTLFDNPGEVVMAASLVLTEYLLQKRARAGRMVSRG